MIVDTSALIAIAFEETGWERINLTMLASDRIAMSATTYVELFMVIGGRNRPDLTSKIEGLLADADVEIIPFTRSQAIVAREAFLEYGRGSGSKARLNYGDCFAYALAKETGEPLLFVGNDFIHTDIIPALDPPVPPSG